MKISTKTQLTLIFLVIACLIGVVTSLIVNSLITDQIIFEAQERVKEDLNTARWVYNSKLRDIERTIHWLSIRYILKNALRNKNILPIRKEITKLMVEEKLDFLTLTDREGIVIFRFHNPEASGDSLIGDIFVKTGLEGKGLSGTQVLSGEELRREGEVLSKKAAMVSIPTQREKSVKEFEETSGMVLKASYPISNFNGETLGVLIGGILIN